jgi:hypothetical protein
VAGRRKEDSLKIDNKKRNLEFKPAMNSREAVKTTARKLLEEIDVKI